jgi:hypothetical protein
VPEESELTDMELDEISLVTRGANQHAKVVLYKGDKQGGCSTNHMRMKSGNECKECGYVKKNMGGGECPNGGAMADCPYGGKAKKGESCSKCGAIRKGVAVSIKPVATVKSVEEAVAKGY